MTGTGPAASAREIEASAPPKRRSGRSRRGFPGERRLPPKINPATPKRFRSRSTAKKEKNDPEPAPIPYEPSILSRSLSGASAKPRSRGQQLRFRTFFRFLEPQADLDFSPCERDQMTSPVIRQTRCLPASGSETGPCLLPGKARPRSNTRRIPSRETLPINASSGLASGSPVSTRSTGIRHSNRKYFLLSSSMVISL